MYSGDPARNTLAMVLAGGKGERLIGLFLLGCLLFNFPRRNPALDPAPPHA